jgi:NTE family protein
MTKKTVTGICLQGGGALGAYELGAMKALYEVRGKGFSPSVVAGISIGAVTAAIIVGAKNDDPIGTLETVWRERLTVRKPVAPSMAPPYKKYVPPAMMQALSSLNAPLNEVMRLLQPLFGQLLPPATQQTLSIWGNPGMFNLRPEFVYMPLLAPFMTTSIYETSPLRDTLAEYVDEEKLNQPERMRLVTTAINIRTGEIKEFDNKKLPRFTFDHVLASGSLPPGFPMTEIDNEYYWDGGIFSNTPLAQAINGLEEIEPDNPDLKRELVAIDLVPMHGDIPSNLMEVQSRSAMMQYANKFKLDQDTFKYTNEAIDLVRKLDELLPQGDPVRNTESFKWLMKRKKIDTFCVLGEVGEGASGGTNSGIDFSEATIQRRIKAGYNDAMIKLRHPAQE